MRIDAIDPKKTAMIVVDMQNDFVAVGAAMETPTARAGRSGFEVRVFEQASELREVGAGVQISLNATSNRSGPAER
jgi:hypothetical protein